MLTFTTSYEFSACHRIHNHENKCAHFHGHNFRAELTAEGLELDDRGRVVDHVVMKELVGNWIEDAWDHGIILNMEDPYQKKLNEIWVDTVYGKIPQKMYLLRGNPTAEIMANHLLNNICPKLFGGSELRVTKVRIWETSERYGEAVLEKEAIGA